MVFNFECLGYCMKLHSSDVIWWRFCLHPDFQGASGAAGVMEMGELMVTILAQAGACNSGGLQAKHGSKLCFPCQMASRL